MAEYINRQAALDLLWTQGRITTTGIKGIPAADVAPVRHGRWIERPFIRRIKSTNIPVVECSTCRLTFCDIINNHMELYRYCPYCGAKMDKEAPNGD